MGIAKQPSVVTLPAAPVPYPSIVEFLCRTFPGISYDQWAQRLRAGKLLDDRGRPITADTPYLPSKRIFYFREVENEPVIPFAEQILFQDGEILVADKPHFLPVIPGGRYVEECLLNRLRARTGIAGLAPLHRLDRETAGLVVFSVNPETRGAYHGLFMRAAVEKIYHALAELNQPPPENHWTVENRIVRGEPRFRMKTVPGTVNARSHIQLVEMKDNRGLFRLQPVTGKTHQLRLHMSGLGFGIINDRVYPDLQPERDDDFDRPLQLLAREIRFHDPIAGMDREFRSERKLLW
ncbi:pseudouridine synthase [Sulfuricaulis limicola]|uniref:Pseudouridine synthase n=1 Tax=Sulfuricaulis limicola TaxID=1620215 RepID=A0A1B4XJC1_9GAMM|nr:pseudouridine synthase [Sulfuricaulis limicola]BAV34905.1 pseudouridine synthase [Sulfuricaulis limicola]